MIADNSSRALGVRVPLHAEDDATVAPESEAQREGEDPANPGDGAAGDESTPPAFLEEILSAQRFASGAQLVEPRSAQESGFPGLCLFGEVPDEVQDLLGFPCW